MNHLPKTKHSMRKMSGIQIQINYQSKSHFHNSSIVFPPPSKKKQHSPNPRPLNVCLSGGGNTCTKWAKASDGSTRAFEFPGDMLWNTSGSRSIMININTCFGEGKICVNTFRIVLMTILILSMFDVQYMKIDFFDRCT